MHPFSQNAAGAVVLAAGQEKLAQKRKRESEASDAQFNACYTKRYHAQLPRVGCARHGSYCFSIA